MGNNSPGFVVPVDSKENKKNIANFFGTQRERAGEVRAVEMGGWRLVGKFISLLKEYLDGSGTQTRCLRVD